MKYFCRRALIFGPSGTGLSSPHYPEHSLGVMFTLPKRSMDMPTALTYNGKMCWKTHGLHLCVGHSLCMHFLITARETAWLAGSPFWITDAQLITNSLVFSILLKAVLAKSTDGFCCEHEGMISLPHILRKNRNCEEGTIHYHFAFPCHFSTTMFHSCRGPKPSLLLYTSDFCICVCICICIYPIFSIFQIN